MILGLSRDNGKENGNYHIVYWAYIGTMLFSSVAAGIGLLYMLAQFQGLTLPTPAETLSSCKRQNHSGNWVAVKELNLSYYIGETLLFTIYTHYGNLI